MCAARRARSAAKPIQKSGTATFLTVSTPQKPNGFWGVQLVKKLRRISRHLALRASLRSVALETLAAARAQARKKFEVFSAGVYGGKDSYLISDKTL